MTNNISNALCLVQSYDRTNAEGARQAECRHDCATIYWGGGEKEGGKEGTGERIEHYYLHPVQSDLLTDFEPLGLLLIDEIPLPS